METRTLECGAFSVRVGGEWCDITESVDVGSPVTLALPSGVGALQFSSARYVAGPIPRPRNEVLDAMLTEFADARELARPRDRVCEDGQLALAAATFSQRDATVRVWYVSDGRSFALVTYTCIALELPRDELRDCEAIVRSIASPATETR